ncbi:acyl-CoA synthetase [Sporolactobacillus sp. THM7-4]|nr:acyl-CoA synthetase [Sporolactobacillus sp. THM7-4]
MNITATYRKTAEKWPDKLAICDKEGEQTYREWLNGVSRAARWLLTCKQVSNHRVGLYLRNTRFFLRYFAAAAKAGWTAVPLDPRWDASELDAKVRLSGLKLIVAESDWLKKCSFPSVRVVPADIADGEERWNLPSSSIDRRTDSQPFYFGFTSGSTGRPKGFVRSHASWVHSFSCNVHDLGWTANDRILIAGSLFNTHFLYAAISGLYIGATIILLPSFSATGCLHLIQSAAPTQVAVVPTMLESLIASGGTGNGSFHWVCTGAKCAISTRQKIAKCFPNSLFDEFYGASELSFVSLCRQEENAPAGSVGRPFFNVSIAIRREDGFWAEPGQTGEIYVKSPLIISYYVTEQGRQDLRRYGEWVTVGDIGYLDTSGFLYIKGRKNGMINYGGLNIFPEEIERILQGCPKVEHAVVIGLPDQHWGEIAAAFVQVRKGENLDKKTLQHYCITRLTAYKVPRAWFFINNMPFTAGGKIDRRKLRNRVREAISWKKL